MQARQLARKIEPLGSRLKRVALLVETSTTRACEIIRGVGDWARAHEQWLYYLEPRGRSEPLVVPGGWRPDGVIARVNSPELARQIEVAGVPCVDVSWFRFSTPAVARCTEDARAVAEMAADHFCDRGLRTLAYCPPVGRPGYVDELATAFQDAAARRHCSFHAFGEVGRQGVDRPWPQELEHLAKWLLSLPRPVGVLAFSDTRGRQVTEACQVAELRVPAEVAVLGSEQDDLSAIISNPPLSSIDTGSRTVGFRAAELLARMMGGESAPASPVLVPPVGVVARQSTDLLATDDELLAIAFAFIRDRVGESIDVGDVILHVGVSRRTLEMKFRDALGKAPAEVIRRVRLERAMRLLYDSDDTLSEIARQSGFPSLEAMNRAFEGHYGSRPGSLRSARVSNERRGH